MKKALSAVLAAALVLSIGATSALAAPRPRGSRFFDANVDGVCDNRGSCFADTNNDGVCDNRGSRFVDTDGDGVCDNRGSRFVDTDGDGVCDNLTGVRVRPQDGTGMRYGRQGRNR